MADLDEAFEDIVRDIKRGLKEYSKEDQRAVLNFLEDIDKGAQTDEEKRERNDYGRYLLYLVQSGDDVLGEINKASRSTQLLQKFENSVIPSTSKGQCPRKDVLAQFKETTNSTGIRKVNDLVASGEITTAAEFIFNIRPYVKDRGVTFQEVLEKTLQFFREIVDDTIDRQIQDEADVMMHTQNDIKQKFRSLTDAMSRRTTRMRKRLFEISPNFDWVNDGKDRYKISKLVTVKRKEMSTDPHMMDKLIHQVFMRSQWLKKELARLQEENANLKVYLDKFRTLAAERKTQESYVPWMLCQEKKNLEKETARKRKMYKKNLEIINALYLEHQKCIEPFKDHDNPYVESYNEIS